METTFPKTNRPMGYEEIEKRYRRLIGAMQWASILSLYEARDCVRAIQERRGSGEAVMHFGGPIAVFQAAIRCRHAERQDRKRLPTHISRSARLCPTAS
jgi:hypothetical protein